MELLWFILGAVIIGGLLLLVNWMRSNNTSFTWYEWLIGAIGLLLLIAAVQNAYGSIIEDEAQAAWMFLLIFGLPALILFAVVWRLSVRRNKAA